MHGIQKWTQRFMIWPVVGDNDTATTRANLRRKTTRRLCEICQMANTCTSWDGSEHVQHQRARVGSLKCIFKRGYIHLSWLLQTAWTILKRIHRAAQLPDQGQASDSRDERNAPVPVSYTKETKRLVTWGRATAQTKHGSVVGTVKHNACSMG